ncbi:E3 SUMO-protein ligase nse2, partial [Colletotrichum somersetense]
IPANPVEMPSFSRMLRQNGRIVGYVKDDVAFLNNNYKPDIPERDTRAGNVGPVDDICENDFPDTESPTAELLRFSHSLSTTEVFQTVLDELGKKLRERTAAIGALKEAIETLDGVVWTIAPYDYAMFMAGQEVPPEDEEWHGICPRARRQAHEWLYQRGRVTSRITCFEREVEELQRNVTAVSAAMRQADDIEDIYRRASIWPPLVHRHLHSTMPVLERRRPGQRRPERRVIDDDDEAPRSDLPEYEPLACPLTAEAKRAIAELSNSRDVHRYQNHVKASIGHLSSAVAGINDSVRNCHEKLQRYNEKRAESNDLDSQEKSQRELELEAHMATLDDEVSRLTAEAEAALRNLIDRQVELDDEKAALSETVSYFQAIPEQAPRQRRRARAEANVDNSNMDEEGDTVNDLPPPPDHSVIDLLRQYRTEKAHAYRRQPAYQRYALNNDYAAFKKLWHDAVHGDTEVPLPNAKRWFDNAGNPVMSATYRQPGNVKGEPGARGADDSDEDLVIAGEIRDYRCPLSMQLFENPVSNNVCSHTYEKQWIVDMLRKAPMKRAQCPVAGCSMVRTCYSTPGALLRLTITTGAGPR